MLDVYSIITGVHQYGLVKVAEDLTFTEWDKKKKRPTPASGSGAGYWLVFKGIKHKLIHYKVIFIRYCRLLYSYRESMSPDDSQ